MASNNDERAWRDQTASDTTKRFARSIRDAFREYPENAIGIAGPVVIEPHTPLWRRLIRWLFSTDRDE